MCAMVYDETRSGNTIVGVFPTHIAAEQAINELKSNGFTADDIAAITRMPEDAVAVEEMTGVPTDSLEEQESSAKGAVTGALGGGSLGATVGWVLAGGLAFLIPVAGPLTVAGALAATVTGALVGGTVGSIAGALANSGMSEHEAGRLEEEIRAGKTVVMVTVNNDEEADNASMLLERYESASPTRFQNRTAAPDPAFVPVGEQPTTATPSQVYQPVVERTTTATTERYVEPDAARVTPERYTREDTVRPMTYDEGTANRSGDYTTLPDESHGSSTRGGVFNEPDLPLPGNQPLDDDFEPRPERPIYDPARDKGPQI